MFTQAASRASTRPRAIFSASSALPAVHKITILSVIWKNLNRIRHTDATIIFQAIGMRLSLGKCLYAATILAVVGFGIYTLRGSQGIPALMKKREEIKDL